MQKALFLESNPLLAHFEENRRGRDFVVGDLHGCLDQFRKLLQHVAFDPERDRVFSVGDLVDRGPYSFATLQLLEQPWFYAVLGNHDAMFLAYAVQQGFGPELERDFRLEIYGSAFRKNDGSDWAIALGRNPADAVRRLVQRLGTLPLLIRVGSGEQAFWIAHAERIAFSTDDEPRALTDEYLLQGAFLDELRAPWSVIGYDLEGNWWDALLWGRSVRRAMQWQSDLPQQWPGVGITFVGHTITASRNHQVREAASHVFLDFGAYQARKKGCGLVLCAYSGPSWAPILMHRGQSF